MRVRIVAEHRGAYEAADDSGKVAWCENTGLAYHVAADKRDLPAVGDWVIVDGWGGASAAVIREILPRTSLLVRKAAGEATAPQPLAANVDVGLVMTSANGDLSPARLDRYLALLHDAGIAAHILLSKADLVDDAAALAAPLAALAPVIPVSIVTGVGLDAARALVGPGRTAVLLGSSGVGKSSLLNALAGTAQPTQTIDEHDRGRHTTTRRELFAAPDGSLWIDTPGMRELGQWVDEDDEEEDAFTDIAELAASCRFSDCKHAAEPGCAVRDAVDPARLASFHKLGEERAVGARKQEAAKRLAETRRAKAKRYAPRPGKPEE